MDKCPKCGEDAYGFINASGAGIYKCGSTDDGFDHEHPGAFESVNCLKSQLAAANEKLAESARLATVSAQLADSLAKDLAAANERAGRLEAVVVEIAAMDYSRAGTNMMGYDAVMLCRKALGVPDAL